MSLGDTGRESLIKNSNQGTTNGRCFRSLWTNLIGSHFFADRTIYINSFKDAYRNNTSSILTCYGELKIIKC